MRHQQIVHVGGMILFLGDNMVKHDAGGGILVPENNGSIPDNALRPTHHRLDGGEFAEVLLDF